MRDPAYFWQGRAIGLMMEKVTLADGRDAREEHFHEGLTCSVVDILVAETREHLVVQLAPVPQGVAVGVRFQIEAPAENAVPRVRVGVDEPREGGLAGKAFRHFEIGRLARETRNAPGGVDEEREAALELISRVNAVGEPTEFAGNGGDFGRRGRRMGDGASKRGRATITVATGSFVRSRAGSATGT